MKYFIFLIPLMMWGVLPTSEMDLFYKQYHDSNSSIITKHTYKNNTYYIMKSIEEKVFKDDNLQEEKVFLDAGVKKLLFDAIKKKYPKMVSIEVSGLLQGKYWEDKHYFHHLAQVRTDSVKPLFSTKTVSKKPQPNMQNKGKALPQSKFMIQSIDLKNGLKKKIQHLESKSKKHPHNLTLLYQLRDLYKEAGDTQGYSDINSRIMDAKMNI